MGVLLVSLQCQSDCKTPKPYSAPDQSLYHLLTQLLILIPFRSPSEQIQIMAFPLIGPETEGYLYVSLALASLGLGFALLVYIANENSKRLSSKKATTKGHREIGKPGSAPPVFGTALKRARERLRNRSPESKNE